jgi:hypothetical protein
MEKWKKMEEKKTIKKLKSLKRELWFYEKTHQNTIKKHQEQEEIGKLTKYLKTLDPKKTLVWCRNGEVTHITMPCKKVCGFTELKTSDTLFSSADHVIPIQRILCPFKPHSSNVLEGCVKCRQFVVTENNENWETAKQLKQWYE